MVKKTFSVLIKIALFVMGFLIAVWVFMPWREIGSAAMSFAATRLEKSGQGLKLNFTDVTGVDGGFTVNNLEASSFMKVSCNALTLKPQLFASILSFSPVCSVSFRGAAITMGQNMYFGDGGFLLTARVLGQREVLLEQLRSSGGDFGVNGYLTIDPNQMKIGRADAALRVPSEFESNMSTLKNFLPLVKVGDNWFLRRNN